MITLDDSAKFQIFLKTVRRTIAGQSWSIDFRFLSKIQPRTIDTQGFGSLESRGIAVARAVAVAATVRSGV